VFLVETPLLSPTEAARVVHVDSDAPLISIGPIYQSDLRLASMRRFKPRSSTRPDGIPVFVAKDCSAALATPLLFLYNMALNHSVYPGIWKLSRVTPIPKGDASNDMSNFRQIAVLSHFAKLLKLY
jgi:hypothetical protein